MSFIYKYVNMLIYMYLGDFIKQKVYEISFFFFLFFFCGFLS